MLPASPPPEKETISSTSDAPNIANNLVALALIMAAYAGCMFFNIKLTNSDLATFMGYAMLFLPIGAITLAMSSKMRLGKKLLSSLGFVCLSLLILISVGFHLGNSSPFVSELIDKRNRIAAYSYSPPSLFSGGDFDVGRARCVQVVQELQIFPGIARQFLLLDECARDAVQIKSLGNGEISCFFPPCYYIGHDSPNNSLPLTRIVRLKD